MEKPVPDFDSSKYIGRQADEITMVAGEQKKHNTSLMWGKGLIYLDSTIIIKEFNRSQSKHAYYSNVLKVS